MNKTFLTVFALIGIFFCGAIVGSVVAVRYARTVVQRKAAEQQMNTQQWSHITKQLNLDDRQHEKLRSLLTTYTQEQQASRKKMQGATEQLHRDVKKILRSTQASDYEKMTARFRDNEKLWQRWIKEQRNKYGDAPVLPPPQTTIETTSEAK